jgi:uncharacterized protein DUF4238
MAGERQHYLPQFLQRGFASREENGNYFTWVCRGDKQAFESNISRIGVERRFYTAQGDRSLDDIITDAEAHEYSGAIRAAREAPVGPIDSGSFPRLFAHLEVRSRHLRQVFGGTAERFVTKTIDAAVAQLPDLLLERWERDPQSFHNAVKEMLDKAGQGALFSPALAEAMRANAPVAMAELRALMTGEFEKTKQTIPSKSAESVKQAHIDALSKTISPEIRVASYERLRFSLIEFKSDDLVLGDSAVLFHVDGSQPFKAMSEKGDTIRAAILPVAPNKILIGSDVDYQIDEPRLKSAIASCSLEFFIAATRSAQNDQLQKQIGSATELLPDSEMDSMVQGILNEYR